VPGPAAYGLGGTDATVTDADIVLGYLNPDYFLGGRLSLDVDRARSVIATKVADPLAMSIEEASLAIVKINDAHMADAIRVVAARAAIDLRSCRLLGCGGAGPVHAAAVAEELGIDEVLIPESPGVFAALGLLCTDVIQDYVRTAITRIDGDHTEDIVSKFRELSARALADFALQGIAADHVHHRYEIDARYSGQGFEIRIDVPTLDGDLAATMAAAFHDRHQEVYGHAIPTDPVDIVSFRLRAVVTRPQYHPVPSEDLTDTDDGPDAVATSSRTVHFPTGALAARVTARAALPYDEDIVGPMVIEQVDTTVIVPPGWTARRDRVGTLVLSRRSS
jgi:N-methylhydantoinase A